MNYSPVTLGMPTTLLVCQTAGSTHNHTPKGIQKNKIGNTTSSAAAITPVAVGNSASLPISSGLICKTGHSFTLKSNSLLGAKHVREEGHEFPRASSHAHCSTPQHYTPLLKKPVQPWQEKWRAEDGRRLICQVKLPSSPLKKQN